MPPRTKASATASLPLVMGGFSQSTDTPLRRKQGVFFRQLSQELPGQNLYERIDTRLIAQSI